MGAVDAAICAYLDVLFVDRVSITYGRYVGWGYNLLFPSMVRLGKLRLPLARDAIRSWARRFPGAMRYPAPLSVLYLFADLFFDKGRTRRSRCCCRSIRTRAPGRSSLCDGRVL